MGIESFQSRAKFSVGLPRNLTKKQNLSLTKFLTIIILWPKILISSPLALFISHTNIFMSHKKYSYELTLSISTENDQGKKFKRHKGYFQKAFSMSTDNEPQKRSILFFFMSTENISKVNKIFSWAHLRPTECPQKMSHTSTRRKKKTSFSESLPATICPHAGSNQYWK